MKSNYKRLGDYIRQVDVRNKGLITSNLLGINIDKSFMPSVANIIGTDLSNYKLITENQFACFSRILPVTHFHRFPASFNNSGCEFIPRAFRARQNPVSRIGVRLCARCAFCTHQA